MKITNPIILTTTKTTSQAMQTIAETTHRTKQITTLIISPITNQAIKQVTPLLNLPVLEKTALAVLSKSFL